MLGAASLGGRQGLSACLAAQSGTHSRSEGQGPGKAGSGLSPGGSLRAGTSTHGRRSGRGHRPGGARNPLSGDLMHIVLDTNLVVRAAQTRAQPRAGDSHGGIERSAHVDLIECLYFEIYKVLFYGNLRRMHGLDDAKIFEFLDALAEGCLTVSTTSARSWSADCCGSAMITFCSRRSLAMPHCLAPTIDTSFPRMLGDRVATRNLYSPRRGFDLRFATRMSWQIAAEETVPVVATLDPVYN